MAGLILRALLLLALINTAQADDEQLRLDKIERDLATLSAKVNERQIQRNDLTQTLKIQQRALNELNRSLKSARKNLDRARAKVKEMESRLSTLERGRHEDESRVAEQLRALYSMDRTARAKVLFNLQQPLIQQRMLDYLDYATNARELEINAAKQRISEIAQTRRIRRESQAQFETEQAQILAKIASIEKQTNAKSETLKNLQSALNQDQSRIKTLTRERQELQTLLEEIQQIMVGIADGTDLSNLKGRLGWPLVGKVQAQFGSARNAAGLKWEGILIGAQSGEPVAAVAEGQVVFADWLGHFGLLLIIDHGNGYMTLYGNNENLLRQSGDWVSRGDVIAASGEQVLGKALYFELRENGTPRNPMSWLTSSPVIATGG